MTDIKAQAEAALVQLRDEMQPMSRTEAGLIVAALLTALRDAEARAEKAEAERDAAVEALEQMHRAVCGETGFAACVRLDSGKAYPWPALDDADEAARATIAKITGEKT